MTQTNYQADEYEMQHYGFSAREFISQYKNTFAVAIKTVLTDMQESIAKKLNLNEDKTEQLNQEISELIKEYTNRIEKQLKPIEGNIQKFFAIPDNVSLENEINENNDDFDSIMQEIDELEKEYKKELMLQVIYKGEIDEIQKLETTNQYLTNILKTVNELPTINERKLENKLIQNLTKMYNDCVLVYKESNECLNKKTKHKKKFKIKKQNENNF